MQRPFVFLITSAAVQPPNKTKKQNIMSKPINHNPIACIHEEADGYHVTRASLPYFDTRGKAYHTVASALRYLRDLRGAPCYDEPEYTHYMRSGKLRKL